MSDAAPGAKPAAQPSAAQGLGSFLIFFIGLAGWTVFMLFAVPAIQARLFALEPKSSIFFQTDYGVFSVIGYLGCGMLVVVLIALLFRKARGLRLGFAAMAAVCLALMASGALEAIRSYSRVEAEGIGRRSLFSPAERLYGWEEVEGVRVSFFRQTQSKGGSGGPIMKWLILLPGGKKLRIDEGANGPLPTMRAIYRIALRRGIAFEARGRHAAAWESLRAELERD